MGKRLYVGNLPFSVSNEQLSEIFSAAGTVTSASVIKDNASGRSKGFGFVEMDTDDAAATAVEQLNGSKVGERQITVAEARASEHRGGGGGGGGGSRGPRREGGGGGGYGGGGPRRNNGGPSSKRW